MFDIGWTELLVIAIVLIVVVGPKDLPPMLRAFGKMTANLRKMAGDFRTQFDEALRESDLDDVRRTISDAQRLNPTNALREAINPLRQMGQDIRSDLQKATHYPGAPEMTKTDIEAQQAVEGAPVGATAPEVPVSFPLPGTDALVAAPAPAQSQPAAIDTVADVKPKRVRKPRTPVAAAEVVAVEPLVEPAAKPKRVRAVVKTASAVEPQSDAVSAAPVRRRVPKKTDTPKDDA